VNIVSGAEGGGVAIARHEPLGAVSCFLVATTMYLYMVKYRKHDVLRMKLSA
jgi:hypothetical protein